MKPSEVLDMFAAISNIDNRVAAAPSREMAYAWADVLQDVPLEVAQEAVVDYYRSARYAKTHDRVTTGDICEYWDRLHSEARAENRRRTNQAAIETRRDELTAIEAAGSKPIHRWAERFAINEAKRRAARAGGDPEAAAKATVHRRNAWRAVECPHCGAQPEERCVIPGTKRELRNRPAHDARLQASRQAS